MRNFKSRSFVFDALFVIVVMAAAMASAFLEALDAPETERERVARVASRQMRLISIGRRHWLG